MSDRHDFDPGCNVLDLIAHCDEGRQEAAINEHFADARRRTLQLGGGKVELTIRRRNSYPCPERTATDDHESTRISEGVPVHAGVPQLGLEP